MLLSCQKKPAHDLSQESAPETSFLGQLDQRIKRLAKTQQLDSAIMLSKEMAIKAKDLGDSIALAKSHFRLGYYNKKLFNHLEAFKNYDKALVLYTGLKDQALAAAMLMSMANIQKAIGDFNGAYISATDALSLLENASVKEKFPAYHIITVSLKEEGKTQQSLEWSDRIKKLLEQNDAVNIKSQIINFENTRANILIDLNQYDEAVTHFQKLLDDESIVENKKVYAMVLTNLARVLWLKDSFNNESESMFMKGLKIREAISDVSGLISSNINLAKYHQENSPAKALQFAEAALKYSEALNNPVAQLEALDLLLSIKSKIGASVTQEVNLYSAKNKHLKLIQNKIRDIYALTKFNSDQLERENLILQAETAKKDKQKVLILVALIIVVLVSSIFMIYKNATRRRELLEASIKTEAKISKKVHDELANDISGVLNYVDLWYGEKEESKEKVLTHLSSLYKKARDISITHAHIDVRDYDKALRNLIAQHHPKDMQVITSPVNQINWNSKSEAKKIALYKGLQELLVNTKKHSKATDISIVFKNEGKKIITIYTDNGVGFMVTEKKLNGLNNVETRMKESDGSFSFESSKGKGFRAHLVI
ncbi:hypothetical protein MTsPCn5_16730 [Croceitalea sp. MTPC5]|nr:hypothetical protein MTsPCn5_16730 [Croceitalea sp. MTPC5]